jgi:hypothetical protein
MVYHAFWYPDFESSDTVGCLKDGKQPAYMDSSPKGYLFESAEECCQEHFMWDIANCRKNSIGDFLWYPKFDSEDAGCRNDGNFPLYFKRYDGYLFQSLEECCAAYYPWSVEECMNPQLDPCFSYMDIYDADFLTEPERGFYPSWDDDDIYCINDGQAPGYMLAWAEAWVDKTLEECCRENFQFAFKECMSPAGDVGLTLNPCAPDAMIVEHSLKWYVIYPTDGGDPVCAQDCATGPECQGLSIYHEELYESYQECCEVHLWWVEGSRCHNGIPGQDLASEISQGAAFTNKWYVIYPSDQSDPVCGQDCTMGPDCIGSAKHHEELYDSYDECCEFHLWWVESSRCYDGR